jgi:hypothetical protein
MKRNYSVAGALLISLFIYLFYRSEKTVVNELITFILSPESYTTIKSSVMTAVPLNNPIIFSLPGGLWVFCATALAQGFYMKAGRYKVQLVLVPILFAVGLEFCQLIHLTNGRFDVGDIMCYIIFCALAQYAFPSHLPKQNILSPFTLHGFFCVACFLSVYLAHVSQ